MKRSIKQFISFTILFFSILLLSACKKDNYLNDYKVIETPSVRMPAEFETSAMIEVTYPNNMPLSVYKTLAEDNNLLVLVDYNDNKTSRIEQAKQDFIKEGINMDHITFLDIEIGKDYTYWIRDFSPMYVFYDYNLSVLDFTYNRPLRIEQNSIAGQLALKLNMNYKIMDIVHTGGNIMQDGRTTAFSDDLVINENFGNRPKVINEMKKYAGIDNYIITTDPLKEYIAHIDCWGKIISPDKIIVASVSPNNPNYNYYEDVANTLSNTKSVYGYNYRVYRIEIPDGNILAPYTNSLIANNHVYVPLGDSEEYNKKALAVYKEALPGYEIIGIKSENFIYDEKTNKWKGQFLNTDAIHCRTHEIPDKDMLFIDSREVYRGLVPKQDYYIIKTNIVSYSKSTINKKDVIINYSINDSDYKKDHMNKYKETTNYTYVFKNLKSGDDVKYYIEASDSSLHHAIDPTCGKKDPHHFIVQ